MPVMLKSRSPAKWEMAPHWGPSGCVFFPTIWRAAYREFSCSGTQKLELEATEHCSEGELVQLVRASGEEKQEITTSVQTQWSLLDKVLGVVEKATQRWDVEVVINLHVYIYNNYIYTT